VTVTDPCVAAIVLPASGTFPDKSYNLRAPQEDFTLSLDSSISPAFCTYDVQLVSVVNSAGADKTSEAIWKWTDLTEVSTENIEFSVQESAYDANLLDTFTVTLRYTWAGS
jgi:hypothetical protein